jgi:hypothetical protein
MKTQEHRIEDLQRSRFEADLEASINALFCRCPALCGFTVREIVAALVQLLDECPEACELLRERTFARVFH